MTPPESKPLSSTSKPLPLVSGFAAKTVSHRDLYNKAIAKRNFSDDDIAKMRLEFWDAEATNKFLGFGNFPSIKIPYFGFDGNPTGFIRVRKLIDDSRMKYSQPRASGVGVYLAPNAEDWSAIARDVSRSIIITEGEFKAWAVQKATVADTSTKGLACLGLAGVTSWGSKTGKPLHDDLMRIKWSSMHGMTREQRRVYIIFDYDGKGQDGEPNPQVAMAEAKLATVLKGLGAEVHMCRVGRFAPDAKFKYAIDDHLEAGGSLGDVLASTAVILGKDDDLSTKLYEFGTKFGFDLNGSVVVLDDGRVLSFGNAMVYAAPHWSEIPAPTQANPLKTKKVYLLAEAKDSARRTEIREVGMFPKYQGMQITPDGCYNLFRDWKYSPRLGDVTPFLELCKYFFQADPSFEDFYHDWVAHVLQKPWERHSTTIQFVSEEEGIGKSFMAEIVAELIGMSGTNCGAAVLGPDEIFSQWSDRLAGKVLVVINEPSSDRANHAKQLKHFITSPKISINKKYGASYSIDNYVNYMFTSNEPFITQMSDGSRREAIYRPSGIVRSEMNAKVTKLLKWLNEDGGYNKILNWYFERDISEFNPSAEAPDTDAKRDAQVASMSDIQVAAKAFAQWVAECGGDVVLTADMRKEMIARLDGMQVGSPQAFHRALSAWCVVKPGLVKDDGKVLKVNHYSHKRVTNLAKALTSLSEVFKQTCKEVEKWV
jgi:hypothetical protein